ncbi:Uncharacterized protein DBV15_10747 [Temnothorax longispinosus]|uniref:Uncharacterized protein n=1 Tax=Temnothorax longispinosus TaxID=300112 RepID=A0A4S2KAV8_9HYME|nr:Uncharacterized protein DBV15_10747 [Temnothorax longispinosus]
MERRHFYGRWGSCPAAPWPRLHFLTQSATLATCARQRGTATRRFPSLPQTFGEGLGKGDDVGIPFGNTRTRWNKRSVLHFNANEKVPRQTKSPRSFISREKPEVGRCECG